VRPLTTLERVQAWLSPDQGSVNLPEGQAAALRRTILGISGLVMSYMNRDTLALTERTETYPSSRTGRIVLRHWPVLTASSVSAPPAPALATSLWSLEPIGQGCQRIIARASAGGSLVAGPDGISVTYVTGFVKYEQHTVPSASPYTVQTSSVMLFDEGVADYTGGVMPTDLYTVSPEGLYTFDPTLAGQQVTLVYSWVPEDIEQVVIDEVAHAWRSRQRIGEQSKALANGGGTSSYTPRALLDVSKQALRNYVRVVPT
jgi:hypothetical protein